MTTQVILDRRRSTYQRCCCPHHITMFSQGAADISVVGRCRLLSLCSEDVRVQMDGLSESILTSRRGKDRVRFGQYSL